MKYNKKNLLNQRFGRLVVIKETEKRMDNGSIVWKCKCDCGNVIETSSKRLTTKMITSCGCYQKERQQYSNRKLLHHQLIDGTNINIISKQTANSSNKTGTRGVHYSKIKKKWIATLTFKKKLVLNKSFDTKVEAIQARKEAENKYFKPILDKYN